MIIFTLNLTSCATILRGRYDKVTITTNPPNADVFVDGEKIGNTESTGNTMKLRKKYTSSRTFTIKKEGYYDTTFVVNTKIEPVYIIGVLPPAFGIPCLVDILTGCALTLKEKQLTKELTPKK